jgi:hypothetical protein
MKLPLIISLLILFVACNDKQSRKITQVEKKDKNEILKVIEYFENNNFQFEIDTLTAGRNKIVCFKSNDGKENDTISLKYQKIIQAKGYQLYSFKLHKEKDSFADTINLTIEEIHVENKDFPINEFYGYCKAESYLSEDFFCIIPDKENGRLFYFQFTSIWGETFILEHIEEVIKMLKTNANK